MKKLLISVTALALLAAPVFAERMPEPFGAANSAPSHATQGYLGVDIRDVTDEQVSVLRLKEARGAEICIIDHDGPAIKAGLRVHDVILQMNGQAIEGEAQLRRMLQETPAGRSVTFIFSRDGQQQSVTVQLANREEVEKRAWGQHFNVPEPDSSDDAAEQQDAAPMMPPPTVQPPHGYLGFGFMGHIATSSNYTGATLDVLGPQLAQYFGAQPGTGLLVKSIDHDSPAERAGLRAGDVVLRVNSTAVSTRGDWMRAIQSSGGKPVTLNVLRDRKPLTFTLSGTKRSLLERPAHQPFQHIASACHALFGKPDMGCSSCF